MKKQKILLVDEGSETIQYLSELLSNKYELNQATDTKTTLNILSSPDRPDLILLDLSMKNTDGYELTRTLKTDARTSEIAIILISTNEDKYNIEKCFDAGAVGCIAKPFYKSEVQSKVKNILQLFHLRDSLSNALEDRQRHLVTVERQLNAIDEHVLYLSLDLENNIKDVSTAFMRLLHCSKDDFIKKNEHCLSKSEIGTKKFEEIFNEVKYVKPYESEIKTKTSDKMDIWLGFKISKDLDYFNSHIGYIVTFHDITDKKTIEIKNKELDKVNIKLDENLNYLKQFKKAVEEASIFSITDEKGIIKEVNKNFQTISGYTEEELLNQPHNIVRHEDMPKEAFKDMWDTIQSGKIWKGMVKNKRKNGKPYYVMSEVVPICNPDGSLLEYISIRSDITELEEYRQLLKNELDTRNKSLEENVHYIEQYEDAINNSMAILKTDLNQIIHYANEKFCEQSGYTLDELVGMDCTKLREEVHKDSKDCKIIADELSKKRPVTKVMTNVKKDGEKYYSNTLFYPVTDISGEVVENLQVMYDLTEIINLNEEITNTQKEVVFTMGAIGETRSKETGYHVTRVAEYSCLFGKLYGLQDSEYELLKQASPMHDIGKVAIPDSILNKPAKLTPQEFDIMKTHAEIGYEMLKHSNRPILRASAEIAITHHEKYDGSGYPKGLKGEDIPIYGRITAIADVFDALGNDRVYKKAWELDDILELFKKERGNHFDPKLIDIFFENLDKFLEIRDNYNES
ncbi:PAS domain S-box protein [Sulfurimonas sp.]